MKIPPLDWDDLVAIGLPASSVLEAGDVAVRVTPAPPWIVSKLLSAAMASPPPEVGRMAYLRHVRDLLIGCTDWTQTNDSPLTETQQAVWATYRQALRDLPQTYSGEGPIPWPVAP